VPIPAAPVACQSALTLTAVRYSRVRTPLPSAPACCGQKMTDQPPAAGGATNGAASRKKKRSLFASTNAMPYAAPQVIAAAATATPPGPTAAAAGDNEPADELPPPYASLFRPGTEPPPPPSTTREWERAQVPLVGGGSGTLPRSTSLTDDVSSKLKRENNTPRAVGAGAGGVSTFADGSGTGTPRVAAAAGPDAAGSSPMSSSTSLSGSAENILEAVAARRKVGTNSKSATLPRKFRVSSSPALSVQQPDTAATAAAAEGSAHTSSALLSALDVAPKKKKAAKKGKGKDKAAAEPAEAADGATSTTAAPTEGSVGLAMALAMARPAAVTVASSSPPAASLSLGAPTEPPPSPTGGKKAKVKITPLQVNTTGAAAAVPAGGATSAPSRSPPKPAATSALPAVASTGRGLPASRSVFDFAEAVTTPDASGNLVSNTAGVAPVEASRKLLDAEELPPAPGALANSQTFSSMGSLAESVTTASVGSGGSPALPTSPLGSDLTATSAVTTSVRAATLGRAEDAAGGPRPLFTRVPSLSQVVAAGDAPAPLGIVSSLPGGRRPSGTLLDDTGIGVPQPRPLHEVAQGGVMSLPSLSNGGGGLDNGTVVPVSPLRKQPLSSSLMDLSLGTSASTAAATTTAPWAGSAGPAAASAVVGADELDPRVLHFLEDFQESFLPLADDGLELDLSRVEIAPHRTEFWRIRRLVVLRVPTARLRMVPPEVGQLTRLRELVLAGNLLSRLPSEIGQLQQLVHLDLSRNRLRQLPVQIGQLRRLQKLDVSFNQLMSLPGDIGRLLDLRELHASNNSLLVLPSEIGHLTQLRALYVDGNALTSLPSDLGLLRLLEVLHAGDNSLQTLPHSLGKALALTELNVRNNPLTALPPSLGQLTRLANLTLTQCPLTHMPAHLRRFLTTDKLQAYWQSLEEHVAGEAPAYRSKLLLVGYGSVGKSTLLHALFPFEAVVEKKRRNMPGWQQRRITIRGPLLEMLDQPMGAVQSSIVLTKATVVKGEAIANATGQVEKVIDDPENRIWTVIAHKSKHPHVFRCSSEAERTLLFRTASFYTSDAATVGVDVSTRLIPSKLLRQAFAETGETDQSLCRVPDGAEPMHLSVLDFAGLEAFQSTHHLFLAREGVYVLLWDVTPGVAIRSVSLAELRSWLVALQLHLGSKRAGRTSPADPIVYIVGNKADLLDGTETADDFRLIVASIVDQVGLTLPFRIVDPISAQSPYQVAQLREAILADLAQQAHVGRALPRCNIQIEHAIQRAAVAPPPAPPHTSAAVSATHAAAMAAASAAGTAPPPPPPPLGTVGRTGSSSLNYMLGSSVTPQAVVGIAEAAPHPPPTAAAASTHGTGTGTERLTPTNSIDVDRSAVPPLLSLDDIANQLKMPCEVVLRAARLLSPWGAFVPLKDPIPPTADVVARDPNWLSVDLLGKLLLLVSHTNLGALATKSLPPMPSSSAAAAAAAPGLPAFAAAAATAGGSTAAVGQIDLADAQWRFDEERRRLRCRLEHRRLLALSAWQAMDFAARERILRWLDELDVALPFREAAFAATVQRWRRGGTGEYASEDFDWPVADRAGSPTPAAGLGLPPAAPAGASGEELLFVPFALPKVPTRASGFSWLPWTPFAREVTRVIRLNGIPAGFHGVLLANLCRNVTAIDYWKCWRYDLVEMRSRERQ